MVSIQASQISPAVVHIDRELARLEAWLETMHGPGGYGGPVCHWWQQSLVYTGPGLDWRYEGIIAGYINLWLRQQDDRWLLKACRAGDDLVSGQMDNGHFPASAFEINPASAGTPHEAACDIGLLLLAQTLKSAGRPGWEVYAACAQKNLQNYYAGKLWDAHSQSILDSQRHANFVPNKAASACEAFFLLADLTGDAQSVEQIALPTLSRIVEHQVKEQGRLDGAIAQNSLGKRRIEKYFPIYNARCIPALLRGYRWTQQEYLADSALRCFDFIRRWETGDGSFPTVVYRDESTNRNPNWIAPLGDILRAGSELLAVGQTPDISRTLNRLLSGQDETGGIQTAQGFAAQAGAKLPSRPDLRDVLHVAGWCDKAFRYLSSQAGPQLPEASSGSFAVDCTFRGKLMHLVETPEELTVFHQGKLAYQWRKGEHSPKAAAPEFWLR